MSRSDSDIDLEKFMPSAEEALKQADHAAAEERLRKAFADPELRAMLAAEGRSVEFTPVPAAPAAQGDVDPDEVAARKRALALNHAIEIDRSTLEKAMRMGREMAAAEAARAGSNAASKRLSPPSPWMKGSLASAVVDAAALPSANAPDVPPVTRPTKPTEHTAATSGQPRTWWTPGRKSAAAIVAAFLPAMIVFILFVKPEQRSAQQTPAATANPTNAVAVVMSTAAVPVVTVAPSIEPTATTVPTTSATAEPTASAGVEASASSGARPASVPHKPQPRGTSDDPYNDASAPTARAPATAEPQPTATPKPPEPPPPTSSSPGLPFRKKGQ